MSFGLRAFICLIVSQIVVGFAFNPLRNAAVSTKLCMNAQDSKKWPGNRPPIANPLILKQKMDAAWGRGRYRAEVWDDIVNPLNDWWEAYAPSEEEVEASIAGYDFGNPQAWCEKNKIDYEATLKITQEIQENKVKELDRDEDEIKNLDFAQVQEDHYKILNKAYLVALRIEDDIRQKQKGQISLDLEDTGVQYKND